jgi:hypothetical protein
MTGTVIYIYGVVLNKNIMFEHYDHANTHLTFMIDNQPSSPASDYYWNGTLNLDVTYEYNTLVYSKAGLGNDTHTLQIALVRGQNSTQFNTFIFDYATYTYAPCETYTVVRSYIMVYLA